MTYFAILDLGNHSIYRLPYLDLGLHQATKVIVTSNQKLYELSEVRHEQAMFFSVDSIIEWHIR